MNICDSNDDDAILLKTLLLEMADDVESIDELKINTDFSVKSQNVYTFDVNKMSYDLVAEKSIIPHSNKKVIDIKFKLLNNPKKPNKNDFKNDVQYNIALKKSQVGVTNTGGSHAVFGKVIGIIMDLITKESPDYITFTADESNRQHLYNSLIKYAGRYIKNYKKIQYNPITNDILNTNEFWLEKIND